VEPLGRATRGGGSRGLPELQHLDRDEPLEEQMLGQEHVTDAARPEVGEELELVGEEKAVIPPGRQLLRLERGQPAVLDQSAG
jgi:hypothetical protein